MSPDGDDLHLGGQQGEGPDSEIGKVEGQGEQTRALIPYRDVLTRYRDLASRTIERAGFPLELRNLVRSYFDRISSTQ